jgi:hypothetical protein
MSTKQAIPLIRLKLLSSVVLVATALSGCGGATAPTQAPAAPVQTDKPAAPAATAVVAAPTSAPEPTQAPTATSGPAALVASLGDPTELLYAALRKQLTSGPFRSKTRIESEGTTIEGSSEFVPPNRLHIKTSMLDKNIEQLYVDGRAWSKDGAAWKESKTPGGPLSGLVNAEFIESTIKTVSDVKLLGPETLNTRAVLKISYVSDLSKAPEFGIPGKQNVTAWIGVADGLLYQQEIISEDFGVASTTTQAIEYDPSIRIEAP